MLLLNCFAAGSILFGAEGGSIEYTIELDGPLTIYRGTVRHIKTAEKPAPEYTHIFEIPLGELTGPAVGSNPWGPMLGSKVSRAHQTETQFFVTWSWPAGLVNLQTYPCWVVSNFEFHIRKTSYNAEDLADLLNAWGSSGVWDLNQDGTVNGGDVALLIGNWQDA